jgi:ABC-type sulfate/molybdate transport systems ATPase subunit
VLEADVEVDRREFTVRASICVAPGQRLALFGPSGAGKTTLLESIAGLITPRQGRITLAGHLLTSTGSPKVAVPPWRRRVGLLRQDPGLFPHLSVRDNLAYAPAAGSSRAGSSRAELTELAELLGLGGLLGAMPARLSGGQAHRVALGRLLLARCAALLLDEPFTGLDASLRRGLTRLVITLITDREIPAVLVAHELADAQAFADRLVIIDRGCLLQDGAPDEVVLRPASRRVAELVGYLGFVPVRGPAPAGDVVAGVHPDRVVAGAHPDRGIVLTGILAGGRPAGAGWEADLIIGTAQVVCRLAERPVPSGQPGEAGEAGSLVVTALDPPCFGADGSAVRGGNPGTAPFWPRQVSA